MDDSTWPPGMSDDDRLLRSSEDHTAGRAAARGRDQLAASGGARKRSGSPHSLKFLAVTAALVGIALGAIARRGRDRHRRQVDRRPTEQWSTWSPSDDGDAGERDIANRVAPLYRASPSSQLAVVTVVRDCSATGLEHARWRLRNAERHRRRCRRC